MRDILQEFNPEHQKMRDFMSKELGDYELSQAKAEAIAEEEVSIAFATYIKNFCSLNI